jgi:putative transposase
MNESLFLRHLTLRFRVSFRDVEELMAARGVLFTYETIRRWCEKFGKEYAASLRRRRARTRDNGIWTLFS